MDMPTSIDKLIARKENGIGWIIFNNPQKRNAISQEMSQAAAATMEIYAKDPEVRVVILRGEGDKAFVSGADISQFKERRSSPEGVRTSDAISERTNKAIRECPKPTIAMIRGYCMGGGVGLAVACDIRIAADDSRFGVPAARLGLGYRFPGIRRLVELVGPAYAAEIFYTGRQFSAQEAQQMGLVNRLVAPAGLDEYVAGYAATIAGNAPMTIAAVKQSLVELRKDPSDRDLDRVQQMVEACFASQDYIEGRTAFMEKRKPVFKGK